MGRIPPHRHRGMLRRELLQVGFLGAFGWSMTSAFGARAAASGGPPPGGGDPSPRRSPVPRARSVILVWMPGGPPQMHFWDPKPDSPAECRGSARPIPTSAPGVQIGSRLPLLARQAHRFAIVRSITLNAEDENHIPGGQELLAGIDRRPPNFKSFAYRDEWPSMGAVLTWFRPNPQGLPTAIHVPDRVRFMGQPVPGESAGWLGSRYDPWNIATDPNSPGFRVPDLQPLPGFAVERIANRRALLQQIDRYRRDLEADLSVRQLSDAQTGAFRVTLSEETRRAFDLSREPERLRDRYGRHTWGQSLLLARRLAQAGVRFVQVNLGDHVNYWDYHSAEDRMMDAHCPPFDRALSAFFEDMAQTGLLDETLVLCLSEMGRNPVLGKAVTGAAVNAAEPDGRNHWQWCWSGLFAGAGVRGGIVVGESDEVAGYVKDTPVFPSDISATVFHTMGIDPASEVRDLQDRPIRISEGEVIERLFRG